MSINQVIFGDITQHNGKMRSHVFYEVTFLYSLGIVECCIPSKLRTYLLEYI